MFGKNKAKSELTKLLKWVENHDRHHRINKPEIIEQIKKQLDGLK